MREYVVKSRTVPTKTGSINLCVGKIWVRNMTVTFTIGSDVHGYEYCTQVDPVNTKRGTRRRSTNTRGVGLMNVSTSISLGTFRPNVL